MILNLPIQIEEEIIAKAQAEGISPENYIIQLIKPQKKSLLQAVGILKNLPDGLDYQNQIRNEWE